MNHRFRNNKVIAKNILVCWLSTSGWGKSVLEATWVLAVPNENHLNEDSHHQLLCLALKTLLDSPS